MALGSRGLVRSREKIKIFYLHYHHAYSHQTWQCGNLPITSQTNGHQTWRGGGLQ